MSKFEMPPRFLRTTEAARFLSLSPRTLEKHRCYGTGPAYRKGNCPGWSICGDGY